MITWQESPTHFEWYGHALNPPKAKLYWVTQVHQNKFEARAKAPTAVRWQKVGEALSLAQAKEWCENHFAISEATIFDAHETK